jgi:chaperonin GroES
MLKLDQYIELTQKAINSPNLAEWFSEDDLKRIGNECYSGYERDERSREHWMRRNEAGMDLALQIQKEKSFPWPGCASVAFPLVTIAAMQFHARAYPAIVSGTDVVKCTVLGDDPTGQLVAQAERISSHMSWQRLYQDKCWEEQEDKSILNLTIVGTNFKKSYQSPSVGYPVSELVLAKNLVINYWAKSVEDCPRKTHKIPMFRNEIYEKVMRGIFCDCLEEPWYLNAPAPSNQEARTHQDQRQGVDPPPPDDTTALTMCEQHVSLDLDGDGYAEPYIVTFEEASKCVCRIVTRFDREEDIERVAAGSHKGKIIRINATEYFTKRAFIPSPDGGIYDIGFGILLGPLNEATSSIINMLLDAGTMQTTAGGFLGRGVKIRGGVYSFAPFEWKRADSTGDDIRKSILPLPVNAPSDVLFQLLGLLIQYTSRISGTTDITVGENPGQNTPAQTSQNLVEMGQKIYNAIFKRIWRSSKEEFGKIFKLNASFLPLNQSHLGGITRSDYLSTKPDQIFPVADPNITSDSLRLQQALALKQAAATTPGYDRDAVELVFLRALRVEGAQQLFKGTQGQPPPEDPKVTLEKLKMAGKAAEADKDRQIAIQKWVAEFRVEQELNNAKIIELQASAAESAANAQSEQAYAQVAMINAQITLAKSRNEHINTQIEHLLKAAKIESDHQLGLARKAG